MAKTPPLCQCGCGEPVEPRTGKFGNLGWKQYFSASCKARASKQRAAGLIGPDRKKVDDQTMLETLAKSRGVSKVGLEKVLTRLAGQGEVVKLPDNLTIGWFVDLIGKKRAEILLSMDATDLANSSLKDKVSSFSALTVSQQLLEDKPTQISGYADRSRMMEGFEVLVREAERRGLILELPASEYEEVT